MSDPMSDWKWEQKPTMQEKERNPAPHSEHYSKLVPEPIDIIENWELNFNLGSVIKYIGRYRFKGQTKADLEKALWYLEREVSKL